MKKLILLAMLMVSPFLAFAQSGVSESGGSSNDLQFCIGLLGSTSTLLKQQGGNDPSVKNVIDTMEALLKVFKKIYISISGDIFTNEMQKGVDFAFKHMASNALQEISNTGSLSRKKINGCVALTQKQ
jgi:hypothetical protein|tara:strand:- start:69 stop:452 length:384 start_codon:yes stop_codon:yes gene_type:complete